MGISTNRRFHFGRNWAAFLRSLNDERIFRAEQSLKEMLAMDDLINKTFLDIGSGSGLFSLAARRLGARVHSFDNDPESVACTMLLKKRYFPEDEQWIVEKGSVLDKKYIISLGKFDVVYAWGVLHHTGNLIKAMDNAMLPVADEGMFFIAIYNHQKIASRFWRKVKQLYCYNKIFRIVISFAFIPLFALSSIVVGVVKYRHPMAQYANYKNSRGMSIYHDWIDWLGGYPFETAKPEDVIHHCKRQGFSLRRLITTRGLGCNQFVFRKDQQMTLKAVAGG